MKTSIVPIFKNKTGDTSDKDNYRPIALVMAAAKLFKICIVGILEIYSLTHDHQFGLSLDTLQTCVVFTVKSLSEYHADQITLIYTFTGRILDVGSAFNRVSHWTLFAKLINYSSTYC